MKSFFKFLFFSLVLVGCGDDDLPRVETLQGFRVLAIIADKPELAAGDSANLRLLMSDVTGGGRIVSGSWRACPDPGIALGAEPTCEGVAGATAAAAFTLDFSDAAFGDSYTGLDTTNTFTVNIPANLLDGANTIQQTNGRSYVAIFRFNVGGTEVRAFKSLFVSNRGTKNNNPANPTIRLNGEALTRLPAINEVLTIDNLTDEETFQAYFSDGTLATLTENYELAWYVSKGSLSAGKVAERESVKFETAPPTGPFVTVVVVRDERGGVGHRVINIP